jgi:tripartite-type tricarboxylate transporter receptor subunit TctC
MIAIQNASRMLLIVVLIGCTGAARSQVAATGSVQTYPERPVRIVTAEAGGGNDFQARQIAQGLAAVLGQPVIVDNRAGIIAVETALKASPNGHTLLYYGGAFWIVPLLGKTSYDPEKDFAPIVAAASSSNILAVNPAVAAKSVKDLIALAKAKPGEINYASGPTGNANHLAAELFNYMAGVNIVRIAYKGTAQAINDVIAGHVQIMFNNTAGTVPHIKSGRLRALAVTSLERSPLVPELPTVAASGLPGFQAGSLFGIWAPAGTPTPIITRLNQEIVKILSRPEIKERFLNTGMEAMGSTPRELAVIIKADMARMDKLIKAAGIKAE